MFCFFAICLFLDVEPRFGVMQMGISINGVSQARWMVTFSWKQSYEKWMIKIGVRGGLPLWKPRSIIHGHPKISSEFFWVKTCCNHVVIHIIGVIIWIIHDWNPYNHPNDMNHNMVAAILPNPYHYCDHGWFMDYTAMVIHESPMLLSRIFMANQFPSSVSCDLIRKFLRGFWMSMEPRGCNSSTIRVL